MPRNKIIHEALLCTSIDALNCMEKQIALAKEMVRGLEYRARTMSEFVRANLTGDEHAFKALAPMVSKGTATNRPYYDESPTGLRTKMAIETARKWKEKHEQEIAASEVPALREGDAPDQAREVPAAPRGAGQDVPAVESEGGNTD